MMEATEILPPPITVAINDADLNALLGTEWLLTNSLGAYASSTPLGCNTRRYHGLLVPALSPPVTRIMTLSGLVEQLILDGEIYDLSTYEFPNALAPRGYIHMVEFRNDTAPTFVYHVGGCELTKQIMLADNANAVAVRYTLRGSCEAALRLRPLTALRDYHGLRKSDDKHQMTFEASDGGVAVQDRLRPANIVHLVSREATFLSEPQWWYNFLYRADIARGQDGHEDLYSPGWFTFELENRRPCQLTAAVREPHPLGFETTLQQRQKRQSELAASVGPEADETTCRLAIAANAFIAERNIPNRQASPTILAGFPWFGDWGRDAFIALPGLLLTTGRYDTARGVFRTFASGLSEGMIPNCFDDRDGPPHYNSIDASLWFIIAAEHYLAATDDLTFWRSELLPVMEKILAAYHAGTRFGIRADADGLLTGGDIGTQLTWMDAKLGDEVITPRHGKAVEVNALWHSAHRILADRCAAVDKKLAEQYAQEADRIGPAFVKTFWNESTNCLFDVVHNGTPDVSIRPNQIFAVSLPHSPLSHEQQTAVVNIVREKLLTPFGLRSLSPDDPRYRRGYGGSVQSRDRAYHQGTVWAYLIGPFIEAYLKVEGGKPHALAQAYQWLEPFEGHLRTAGLGSISEIFDGDPPHTPRGCFAQAWSVAEVLRARRLIVEYRLNS